MASKGHSTCQPHPGAAVTPRQFAIPRGSNGHPLIAYATNAVQIHDATLYGLNPSMAVIVLAAKPRMPVTGSRFARDRRSASASRAETR